jgi:hypothetical protein
MVLIRSNYANNIVNNIFCYSPYQKLISPTRPCARSNSRNSILSPPLVWNNNNGVTMIDGSVGTSIIYYCCWVFFPIRPYNNITVTRVTTTTVSTRRWTVLKWEPSHAVLCCTRGFAVSGQRCDAAVVVTHVFARTCIVYRLISDGVQAPSRIKNVVLGVYIQKYF